ncbi:MAG: histidine kinase dimerization/phosphoacceptor domain -containing protein [Gracilimonas sp.]
MGFRISGITKHLAVGFVLVSALVMGYILYELEKTKKYFANQLIEESLAQVESELDEFFHPVENLITTLKRQKEYQFFTEIPPRRLNQFFVPVIDHYPQISSVGLADERGYELNILPDTVNGQWLNREVYVDEWGMVEKWSLWDQNKGLPQLESWEEELKIDPRDRPWYEVLGQRNNSRIHWTEPYEFLTNNEIGLSASIEWISSENLASILTLDLTIKDITKFSQGLEITNNNQIFILTKEGKNIIGLPQENSTLNPDNMTDELLSTPAEFGSQPLIMLTEFMGDGIVNFNSEGETWWGIIDSYAITDSQELLIAVLIPEEDFAAEINSTEGVMVAGFIVILLLASLVVRSHNRLRKAKTSLKEQNITITKQKERLFAEVHHRVKNNLAVMAALIELENMQSKDEAIKEILTQTQRRIKSMSAVHEIMYKTDDVNKVNITEFIPGILNFSRKDFQQTDIQLEQQIDDIMINVNQALTYALLLNEFMSSILKARLDLDAPIQVEILKKDDTMITVIKINTGTDYFKTRKGVGKQLIQVLMAQLSADLTVNTGQEFTEYQISFELKDVKGITSNHQKTELN